MVGLRAVRRDDLQRLVELGALFHAESAYSHMRFDAEKLRALLDGWIGRDDRFMEVITDADSPVGTLIGWIAESYFGPDLVAYDLEFFLLPAYRRRCGRQLFLVMKHYREWATERGAKLVTLGASSQINSEETESVIERLGYPKTGTLHALTVH